MSSLYFSRCLATWCLFCSCSQRWRKDFSPAIAENGATRRFLVVHRWWCGFVHLPLGRRVCTYRAELDGTDRCPARIGVIVIDIIITTNQFDLITGTHTQTVSEANGFPQVG